jgi:hypothetical protein
MAQQSQQKPMEIKIKVPDNLVGGVYANYVIVSHTKEEFIMTFIMISPPQGIVTSRVVMSPSHTKRLANALNANIKKYEEAIARIAPASEPKEKLGFHTG